MPMPVSCLKGDMQHHNSKATIQDIELPQITLTYIFYMVTTIY